MPTVERDDIARAIVVLRGQRVLLDEDLAELYGVAAKALRIYACRGTWPWLRAIRLVPILPASARFVVHETFIGGASDRAQR